MFVTWLVLSSGRTLPSGFDPVVAAQGLPALACAVAGGVLGGVRLGRKRSGIAIVITVVAAATSLLYAFAIFAIWIGMPSPA